MLQRIVLEIPAELKSLSTAVQQLITHVADTRESLLGFDAVDYASIESEVESRVAELVVAIHGVLLKSVDLDAERLTMNGELYRRVATAVATYYSLSGPVRIERGLYRKKGQRGGKTMDAISARIGTYGRGWLPRAAAAMALLHQQGTSREAHAVAESLGRLPYSRSSFDTVPHELAEQWMHHRADIEDSLIRKIEIPTAARAIGLSLDRTSVPMEEKRNRKPGRPKKGEAKNPVCVKHRMAFCGCLTLHDWRGKCIDKLVYSCMPDGDVEHLVSGMCDDFFRVLAKRPHLKTLLLQDGGKDLWKLFEEHMPPDWKADYELIDFWHLLEKLGRAAKVAFGNDAGRKKMQEWKRELLHRNGAAARICEELRDTNMASVEVDGDRPVHEAITYIENNAARMDYARAQRTGTPIGSGNIEATCKTLITVRMKTPGSRWKSKTGEHVLQLRSLAKSNRWNEAMHELHKSQRQPVRIAA